MNPINNNNILPFYSTPNQIHGLSEHCSCCVGITANSTGFIPFDVITTVDVPNTYFEILDTAGNVLFNVNDTNITKTSLNGGALFSYQYRGLGLNLPVGNYLVRLRTTTITSEVVSVCSFDSYLEFWNVTDLCGILYQNGFKQRIYFKSHEDYPITNVETESVTNSDGASIPTFTRTTHRRKIVFIGLFPSQFAAFNLIGQHSNVVLHETKTGLVSIIKGGVSHRNIDVEIENLPCLSKASFIFDTDICIISGCQKNEFTI